ncbi:MAG: zinc ribbon domain-containing protein [Prevotella sp.]|jgi:predicted amidophosphoribosyltransferase|nr:zinc ribbon domain-containing protein [Prevotella sp.]
MANETTQNPVFNQQRQMDGRVQSAPMNNQQSQQAQQFNMPGSVVCQQCGTTNTLGTLYCVSCGSALHSGSCPHCGSPLDDDADYCEVCHHYVRQDVCSFCGARFAPQDAFCPECGSPRGGIVCPTCHTLSDFAFCKQCGTPLTEEAQMLMKQMKQMPEYQEMVRLAKEYDSLQLENPISTEREKARDDASQKFREHVLKLLAQDEGVTDPVIPKMERVRMSKDELAKAKEEKLARIAELLSKMPEPAEPTPAKVRNYAMAQKPAGVRLAWVCNWKHAMHSSPCGCAKPQMGGKWVILGRGSKQEIKDDK